MRFVLFAIALLAFGAECRAQATTSDASQTVTKLLAALGPIPHTYVVSVQKLCHQGGEGRLAMQLVPCWHNEQRTDVNVLAASNIRIVKSNPISFDTPIRTELPSQLSLSATAWANCSKQQTFTDTETLSVAFQRSSSISITNTISHAQSEQLNISAKIYDVTIGGNVQITDTVTQGTTDTKSYQNTVTRTKSISTPVPPQKAFGAAIETWPVQYKISFHTIAVVDADLSANDKFVHLSDAVLEPQRTFPISGVIGFVDAADGRVISYDLEYDFSKCPSSAGIIPLPVDAQFQSKQISH